MSLEQLKTEKQETKATSILRNEHEAILRMLDAAEEAAAKLEEGGPVSSETLRGLVEFFSLFADQCHHGKEEEVFFPLLEKKGLPRSGGPIGVMLVEHEEGRALLRQMQEAAEESIKNTSGAGDCFAQAVRAYAELLRGHISKENNVLFRVAEHLLTDYEQIKLAAELLK